MGTKVKVKVLKAQVGRWGEHLPKGTIITGTIVAPDTIQFGMFDIHPKETCLIEGDAYKPFFGQVKDKKTGRCRKPKWYE